MYNIQYCERDYIFVATLTYSKDVLIIAELSYKPLAMMSLL